MLLLFHRKGETVMKTNSLQIFTICNFKMNQFKQVFAELEINCFSQRTNHVFKY